MYNLSCVQIIEAAEDFICENFNVLELKFNFTLNELSEVYLAELKNQVHFIEFIWVLWLYYVY
jgi:hypothetical protein